VRLAWVMIVTVLLAATAASGQIAPPDAKRAERVAALIQWVDKQGKDSALDGLAAQALGLEQGVEKIPAKRKAFQDDGIRIVYAVNRLQVDGKEVHVLFRVTTMVATDWLIGQTGAVETVAELRRGGSMQQIKDPRLKLLEETIAYLETEMRKANH
jgi:hypothetical protein